MNHTLRMVLGCVFPMVLIFLLPLFGVGEGVSLFVFLVLMFGCHLLMMGGHHEDHGNTQQPNTSREKHEHH